MAAKRPAPTEPETAPEEQPAARDEHPSGWSHDWRNPVARFRADDHCVDAELGRLAPR